MGGTLKFFLNAIKAIIFSPFYILVFIIFLLYSAYTHIVGEFKVLFTGFKYGTKKNNKYNQELEYRIKSMQNGGVNR